jgi:hypothetical protein
VRDERNQRRVRTKIKVKALRVTAMLTEEERAPGAWLNKATRTVKSALTARCAQDPQPE